jgi:hypothetical protein
VIQRGRKNLLQRRHHFRFVLGAMEQDEGSNLTASILIRFSYALTPELSRTVKRAGLNKLLCRLTIAQ